MDNTTQLAARAQPGGTAVAKQPGEQPTVRQTCLAPLVGIFENRQGITLFADLSGVPRGKLDVRVQDDTLTTDAELTVPAPQGLRLQYSEVRYPHFLYAFVLSLDFDALYINVQLRDGVLKLTILRHDETKPRRTGVQAD